MKIFKFFAILVLVFSVQSAVLQANDTAGDIVLDEEKAASGTWEKAGRFALLYLPNVFADLLDIVGMEVSFGNTFALDVHATSMFDFGLENSDAYFAGFGPLHHFGAGRREAQRMAALCWSYEDIYVSQTVGSMPSYSMEDTSFNLVRCYTDAFKDRDIDYLAIGARVAMFVGFAVDFHAAAIPDFLCSLVGFDLYGDNWK